MRRRMRTRKRSRMERGGWLGMGLKLGGKREEGSQVTGSIFGILTRMEEHYRAL